jgi:tight adherence protein C
MFTSQNLPVVSMIVFLAVFGVISAVGFFLFLRARGDRKRALGRLRELGDNGPSAPAEPKAAVGDLMGGFLPKFGAMLFQSNSENRVNPLKQQLLHAGFYRPNAAEIVMGAKAILMVVLPFLVAAIPYFLGHLSWMKAIVISISASAAGMIIPGLWLDAQVRKRQRALRQALPDALDMLVMCLEGGVSMTAAFQRVTGEMQVVHPCLGAELNIIQREIAMGLSIGESIKKMGERCGLDDLRELASVLIQSERYGASAAKTLRTHAETWRQERQSRIEEQAQKAAVKILFPTLLCIFPAIFIVLLGPAAMQMANLFSK